MESVHWGLGLGPSGSGQPHHGVSPSVHTAPYLDQKGLRTILRTIGLSDEAIEDIIDRIIAFLSPKVEQAQQEFPSALRDDFLSQAELSFCQVLRMVVREQLVIAILSALTGLHLQNLLANVSQKDS